MHLEGKIDDLLVTKSFVLPGLPTFSYHSNKKMPRADLTRILEEQKAILPSAREYLALETEFLNQLNYMCDKTKFSSQHQKQTFRDAMTLLNGFNLEYRTRTAALVFFEEGKPYVAFGEIDPKDWPKRVDMPYLSQDDEFALEFISKAKKSNRVISEFPNPEKEPYCLLQEFPSKSSFVVSDVFPALFGADLGKEYAKTEEHNGKIHLVQEGTSAFIEDMKIFSIKSCSTYLLMAVVIGPRQISWQFDTNTLFYRTIDIKCEFPK